MAYENKQDMAILAAMKYLRLSGVEEIDEFEGFLVFEEEGELVFAGVEVADCFDAADADKLRPLYEIAAIHYLAQNPDDADVAVRFDRIQLHIIGNDRAFLKHHSNFLAEC